MNMNIYEYIHEYIYIYDFVFLQPHIKWQHKMASHENISRTSLKVKFNSVLILSDNLFSL